MTAQGSQQHPTNPAPCAPSFAIETFNTLLYNQLEGGRNTMTQRQLNMIQAIEDGITFARSELTGPGSDRAIRAAMAEIFAEEQKSLGLAKTAYLACCLIAWKERGSPDYLA